MENGEKSPEDLAASLADAERTIAAQSRELERLRAGDGFAQQVRDALETASATVTIGSSIGHSRLLEMIVETAVHIISAQAGALLLTDEEAEELIFEVAVGGKAEEVKRFRVPLGHGIAGLVALTGQPMSIADTTEAPTAREIAESVGYEPRNLLCVPLFYGEDVIGVLELLDKQGAEAFGPEDMEALSLFANQAAIAIEQSKVHRSIMGILREALSTLDDEKGALGASAASFAAEVEGDETYRQTLELARLVQEVAGRGEQERAACQAILGAFAEYLGSPATATADAAT